MPLPANDITFPTRSGHRSTFFYRFAAFCHLVIRLGIVFGSIIVAWDILHIEGCI